jgi:hypothetical protein
MMTHGLRIRRQLRSARMSALTSKERREALLEAERAAACQHDQNEASADAGHDSPPEARAGTP